MAYDRVLADRLRAALATIPDVTDKRMFGGLAFLVDGRLVASASGRGGLLLRVDPAESQSLLAPPHVTRFVMRGRELAGWLHVAGPAIESDDDLDRWVGRGVRYAAGLAP